MVRSKLMHLPPAASPRRGAGAPPRSGDTRDRPARRRRGSGRRGRLTASASSAVKLARSAGDRKRTSVSIESVARRLAGLIGAAHELAHLAHDARGEREEIAGGESIRRCAPGPPRLRRGRRRDDVGGGAGLDDALGEAAPGLLADEVDEAVGLEQAQVVVDALARQADAGGEAGWRRRGGRARRGGGRGRGRARPRRRPDRR